MSCEYFLNLGDRVRFQKGSINELDPKIQTIIMSLRGTVVEIDEESRDCDYYLVDWDDAASLDFNDIFDRSAPAYLDLTEFIQGDLLEPMSMDGNPLLDRHSIAEQTVLEIATTALSLYGGNYMNRSVSGAFYDIVEALDKTMLAELREHGPDWVHNKYFREEE